MDLKDLWSAMDNAAKQAEESSKVFAAYETKQLSHLVGKLASWSVTGKDLVHQIHEQACVSNDQHEHVCTINASKVFHATEPIFKEMESTVDMIVALGLVLQFYLSNYTADTISMLNDEIKRREAKADLIL